MTPDVSFACDGRGNRTYDGTWATVGAFQETTEVGAELEVAVVGESIDLTLGNGVDHGICDIYVNSVFWGSIDTYSDSASEETVTIELNHRGPHVLRIRNTGDEHLDATGHKLRFKQVVLPVAYDVHTIQYTYDALSRLMAADYYPADNLTATPFREYAYSYDVSGNRESEVVKIDGSVTENNGFTYDDANRIATLNSQPLTSWIPALLNYDCTFWATFRVTWKAAAGFFSMLDTPKLRVTISGSTRIGAEPNTLIPNGFLITCWTIIFPSYSLL